MQNFWIMQWSFRMLYCETFNGYRNHSFVCNDGTLGFQLTHKHRNRIEDHGEM
jgi:hypothetical protein